MDRGEAMSIAPNPPGCRRQKAGNEGLWGHMSCLSTKVGEQQGSPRGRKQEGHNLGPTSGDGRWGVASFSEAQAAAKSTRTEAHPGCENNTTLI